jgi:putative transposase
MDISDAIFTIGRKIRTLTIVDTFGRYCLGIRVDKSIKGIDVIEVLDVLKNQQHLFPKRIQVDKRREFISKDFEKWANYNNYQPHSSLNEMTPAEVVLLY